jgi:hypothetical protein
MTEPPIIIRSPKAALQRMRTMAKVVGCPVMTIRHRGALVAYMLGNPATSDAETWFCTLPRGGAINICHLRSTTYRAWRQTWIDNTRDGNLVVAELGVGEP